MQRVSQVLWAFSKDIWLYGERLGTIGYYFFAEFITALLLYSMPIWIDASFIAHLKSTDSYATLGVTNNFLHVFMKAAEAISVGTVILSGQANGHHEEKQLGTIVRDSFWLTCTIGLFFCLAVCIGAPYIYRWYGVCEEVVTLGIPFLRTRALGVFFSFIFATLGGFLRGVKQTSVLTSVFATGSLIFILCDYLFIFGAGPVPALGLKGSALATVVQYGCMSLMIYFIIRYTSYFQRYNIRLFSGVTFSYIKKLIILSWPVLIDKSTMALSYVWLYKMICPLGTQTIAALSAVKDMERFGLLPALALSNVITFLVSNNCGNFQWEAALSNIKKTVLMAIILVSSFLFCFSLNPRFIAQLFDKTGDFMGIVEWVFPIVSVLVVFDVIQLVLAGALRGSGNVTLVMLTRIAVTLGFFIPLSYGVSYLTQLSSSVQLVLMYVVFYCGNALMSLVYIYWFSTGRWRRQVI